MNWKNTVIVGMLAPVFFAVGAEVKTFLEKARVYQPEKYSLAQGITTGNGLNNYVFTVVQSKPEGEKPPRTQLWLSAGNMGFCPLVNFMSLNVNGIASSAISPKVQDITHWKEKNDGGSETKFNFDGVKLILRFYMRPDSPVLWGSIRVAPDSAEPIKNMDVNFTALVSHLARDAKKTPLWVNAYERTAVTPARILKQQSPAIRLNPQDTYIIFQDQKFDGSSPEKGWGPCMVILDHDGIEKADLILRNEWTSSLKVVLKPDFKEFRFGLWQQNPRISNTAFAEKLKQEKTAFIR